LLPFEGTVHAASGSRRRLIMEQEVEQLKTLVGDLFAKIEVNF
jgi:hypothetical protein